VTRTTLDIEDGVLRELKARREREQRPLGVIASELLARALHETTASAHSLEWVSRPMAGLIDLEDRDAVWAALDRDRRVS
jgi:hypothetical protein